MGYVSAIDIWVPIRGYDPQAQFGDTHVFRGTNWTYFWAEDTGRLRRLSNVDDEWDLVYCRARPNSPLALTQRFYSRRAAGHRTKPHRYRPPNWRRGMRLGNMSWAPQVRALDVSRMYLPDLTAIWAALPRDPSPLPQDLGVAAVMVQRELARLGMCVVSDVMPNMGAITIKTRLHVVRVDQLPTDVVWAGERSIVRQDYVVVSVVDPSPKRPGSASARRFSKYRVGMTLADYQAAQSDERDRRAARGDWAYDEAHGHIVLRRPDAQSVAAASGG